MTRIEDLMRRLYLEGSVGVAEANAIARAVENVELTDNLKSKFGTWFVRSIEKLREEM